MAKNKDYKDKLDELTIKKLKIYSYIKECIFPEYLYIKSKLSN